MNADVNESKELKVALHCTTKQRGKRDIAFFIIFRLKVLKENGSSSTRIRQQRRILNFVEHLRWSVFGK